MAPPPPNQIPLGFGCSALLGPLPRSEALRLLRTAYDAGIRHFDVARSYGSGDAEALLGEFLPTCPEPVSVATKFGLKPPEIGKGGRVLVSLARRIMRFSPRLRAAMGGKSRSMVKSGAFSVDDARAALEKSLQELRLERIPVYLLHDCEPADCTAELASFLNDAVASGRIGAFGVATGTRQILQIDQQAPEFTRVVQYPFSLVASSLESLPVLPGRAVFKHGAVGNGLAEIEQRSARDPQAVSHWSAELGLDLGDPQIRVQLLLNVALLDPPQGVVLFRSAKVDSIKSNVRSVIDKKFPDDQLRRFLDLLRAPADHASPQA